MSLATSASNAGRASRANQAAAASMVSSLSWTKSCPATFTNRAADLRRLPSHIGQVAGLR